MIKLLSHILIDLTFAIRKESMKNPELTIIIPAKNEAKRIAPTLNAVGRYFSSPDRPKTEILVIINNTTDNTEQIVKKFSRKYKSIKSVNIPMYTGKGGAISIGFQFAKGKYVAFADADGSSTPREIEKLYKKIISDESLDIVIADRYSAGSMIKGNMPVSRTIFSRFFNLFVVRGLFGLNYADTQCGCKIFKNETAKLLSDKIVTVGWLFDLNLILLAKYLQKKVTSVPATWTYKEGSTLKASNAIKEIPKAIFKLKWMEIKSQANEFVLRFNSQRETAHLLSPKVYPWTRLALESASYNIDKRPIV